MRQAAARLAALGAEVIELSIPLHRQGHAIWTPIAVEGSTQQMKGYNYGSNWKGLYVTSLMQAQRHWRDHADEFPHDVKTCLLAGEYFHARYAEYYAKAQNLARRLAIRHGVDPRGRADAPVPMRAQAHRRRRSARPPRDPSPGNERQYRPLRRHRPPAMSVPCALRDGLPVGMMIGRRYGEATLYRAAHAFERALDWTAL